MALRNTTKIAWQAAAAITIAEILSYFLNLERGYWITLTAMALTTQSWGESLKRSLERVSMTILGGAGGTLLYWLTPQNQYVILGIMLLFVFFAVYLFQIFHLAAMIALTGFVVYLFAMFGDWNLYLLRERILDTALGAAIALTVSTYCMPVRTNVVDLFVRYIEKIQASLSNEFLNRPISSQPVTVQQLYLEYQLIRKNALSISYEVLFHRINRKDFHLLLTQTAFCTHYVVGLIEAYSWLSSYINEEDKKRILLAVDTTINNLDTLKKRLKKETHAPMLPAINIIDILTKAIKADPARFSTLESKSLGFFNLMYFFTRLNTRLNEIYSLLEKVKK
ncbi:FUSC family protein [Legionella sp. 16cNR16C]|uniref:FUSC family protein n=1 Tax=Legionella sp. 16cNR16C TaxID=2905656 RepID=UPI001E2C3EAF|nr:FUSC family protein [Legionella sp. 16cNR16C]MCE3043661.1 FUSC family protein [Legionella sp. 16cNR16C]